MLRHAALATLAPITLVTLATGSARAQAPGASYAQPPGEAPVAPIAPVAPVAAVDPMAHRFAIGVGLGGFAVAPEDAPEGSETEFKIAELALRFRATRRLELFVAFTGGRQVLEDDQEGPLATDMVTLGARVRFRPEQAWNWFVLAGFGSTLIADRDTPEELRGDLRRGHAMLGVGVERRWRHFAVQAELRGIGIAPHDDEAMATPPPRPTTMPIPENEPPIDSGADKLSGGQLTIGASYYF
jgi:hypothetical protein